MSVRELVFQYSSKGARQAAKADQRVRSSVQRTGRAAQRNSGEVERWMQRSRKAIQMVKVASMAAVGAILAASTTIRAQLSGMRTAFTLFADTIVRDLLPGSQSLGVRAVELAQSFRSLDTETRTVVGGLILMSGVAATAAATIGALPAAIIAGFAVKASVIALVAGRFIDLRTAMSGFMNLGRAVVSLIRGDIPGAIDHGRQALRDFWNAGAETRQRILSELTRLRDGTEQRLSAWATVGLDQADRLRSGVTERVGNARERVATEAARIRDGTADRLGAWAERGRNAAARLRDGVIDRAASARDRALSLLDMARQMAARGRGWIGGLLSGVRQRAGELPDAFRNMAREAATAFRSAFNDLIPSSLRIARVSVSVPDILGGGSVGVGPATLDIPQLDTGGRIVGSGLAKVHAGERIVPAAQVRDRGEQPVGGGGTTVENVTIVVPERDNAGRQGRDIAREFQKKLGDRGAGQ